MNRWQECETQVGYIPRSHPSAAFAPSFAPAVQVGAIPAVPGFFWWLSAASAGLSAYHGYRRNLSIPWGIGWGALGALFPVITPAIAIAQGYGKRA